MIDDTKAPRLSRGRFLATSALAAGSVAGAGALLSTGHPSRAEAARDRATSTVTVMYTSGEFTPALQQLFRQRNPDLTLQFIEYNTIRLSAMLAAGQPPDFLRANGATEVASYAARGLLADLTPRFQRSARLSPGNLLPINDLFRWNGSAQGQGPRYGAVKDWSPDLGIWYNKKLFAQAGVQVPSETQPLSYDELLALAKKLTVRQGGKTQVYGLDTAFEFGFTYGQIVQMMAQQGKSLFNHDYTASDFTSPEARKVLKWYVDWAQARVGPSPLDPGDNAFTLFLADRLAMVQFGYWFGGVIGADTHGLSTRTGLAPAPVFGATRISGCTNGTGGVIPSGARNKDAGFRAMEFLLGNDVPAQQRVKTAFGLPALKPLLPELPRDTPFHQESYRVVQDELKYFKVLRFAPYISNDAMSKAIAQ